MKALMLLILVLLWFTEELHSCGRWGTSVKKPPVLQPPPWFAISSFGRLIDYTCDCGISAIHSPFYVPPSPSTANLTSNKAAKDHYHTYHSVTIDEYPWQSYIKVTIGKANDYRGITGIDGSYDCSGTVINDRIILTSAECVYQYDPAQNRQDQYNNMTKIQVHQVKVRINMHDKSNFGSSLDYEVENIIVHPEFIFQSDNSEARKTDHDIALLQLRKPVSFNEDSWIRPICIPNSHIPYNSSNPLDLQPKSVVGWTDNENELKTFPLRVGNCPEEETKPSLDLRNYCCPEEIHEDFGTYPMMNYGSPLTYKAIGKNRVYQHGILSSVLQLMVRRGKFRIRPTKLRLFTNITRPDILSFIDYHSFHARARWCNDIIKGIRGNSINQLRDREQRRHRKVFDDEEDEEEEEKED